MDNLPRRATDAREAQPDERAAGSSAHPAERPAAGSASLAEDDELDDDTFDDWEDDVQPTRALFPDEDREFPTAQAALDDAKRRGCDLRALVKRLGLDTLQVIRLINYVRRPAPGKSVTPAAIAQLRGDEPFLTDDAKLHPVPGYETDGLLQVDFDEDDAEEADDPAELRAELASVQQAYQELRRQYAERLGIGAECVDKGPPVIPREGSGNDASYFESYAGHVIHQTMISDSVRTLSYAKFLLSPANAHLLRGKVVMDVGCGSGILSLFCARAGARQVLAVDASGVAERAAENVENNGFGHVVRVFHGKLEELDEVLAPWAGGVDLLVSEWMGYFLLYESMLPSVLYARDRYLRPEGVLAPSHCRMLLAAATDHGNGALLQRQRFWSDVYGFRMPAMAKGLAQDAGTEEVEREAVVSDAATVYDLPLRTMPARQPSFRTPFSITCTESCTVHAFVSWFDTWFTPQDVPMDALPPCTTAEVQPGDVHGLQLHGNAVTEAPAEAPKGETVSFTTSPFGKQTHWKQTVFLLKTPLEVRAGMRIDGELAVRPSEENERELDVELVYAEGEPRGERHVGTRITQLYSVR